MKSVLHDVAFKPPTAPVVSSTNPANGSKTANADQTFTYSDDTIFLLWQGKVPTVITPAVEPNSSTTTTRWRLRCLNSSSSSVSTLVSGTTSTSCMIWLIFIDETRAATG